ncbi:ABC transporter substrate-binding protein [Jatrophihabitans sp. DSM 45814]
MHGIKPHIRGAKRLGGAVVAAAAAVSLLAACSGSSTSAAPAAAKTNADGTPNLTGQSIRIAVGAAPEQQDSRIALMATILDGWGAKTKIINQTGDPAGVRVVLAGDADLGSFAVSGAINSGLKIFGPSQPRLDYHFIGAPSLKSINDLPGKIYGTSNIHGVEALMFADLLKKNNIQPSQVKVTVAGGASVRVGAMLTHHIDATFVHVGDVPKLTSAGFNDLAKMSDAAPELADSYLSASPKWYSSHPDLAVAVDEAWIKAAQIFNTDEAQWVKASVAYGGGTEKEAQDLYTQLKSANTFPAEKDVFSTASAQQQEDLAKEVGAITTAPPLSQWFDITSWDKATAALNLS